MAAAPPVPLTPELDFRAAATAGHAPTTRNCTRRRQSQMLAARIVYPDVAISLLADPLFEQVMLYAPEGKPFFAVEPQTNANDGFNLYDRGVAGNGVFVLEPGESNSGMIRFQVEGSRERAAKCLVGDDLGARLRLFAGGAGRQSGLRLRDDRQRRPTAT